MSGARLRPAVAALIQTREVFLIQRQSVGAEYFLRHDSVMDQSVEQVVSDEAYSVDTVCRR